MRNGFERKVVKLSARYIRPTELGFGASTYTIRPSRLAPPVCSNLQGVQTDLAMLRLCALHWCLGEM